jgi:hypothetical protein
MGWGDSPKAIERDGWRMIRPVRPDRTDDPSASDANMRVAGDTNLRGAPLVR